MISFIVPAHNEAQCIAATLDALHQTSLAFGGSYEVVVADDGSTDETAAIAAKNGAAVVSVAAWQIAATRNAGSLVARGDMLIFVDSDTKVNA